MILLTFIGIAILSVFMAAYSMKDIGVPADIQKLIRARKVRGSILFFKDKIKHYSSLSSSSSDV